jgi:hypothetical protein
MIGNTAKSVEMTLREFLTASCASIITVASATGDAREDHGIILITTQAFDVAAKKNITSVRALRAGHNLSFKQSDRTMRL